MFVAEYEERIGSRRHNVRGSQHPGSANYKKRDIFGQCMIALVYWRCILESVWKVGLHKVEAKHTNRKGEMGF